MSRFGRKISRRKSRVARQTRRRLSFETLENRCLLAVSIPGNFDFFITDPGSTDIDVGTDPGGDNPPLPAGFFGSKAGTPSDPFVQADILLEGNPPVMDFDQFPQPLEIQWVDPHGNPVGPDSMHAVNQVLVPDTTPFDTVIQRLDPATFNGTSETQNVDIEIVALSLQSVDPIMVTYGAEPPSLWDVFVELDDTATQPTGSIDLFSTTFTGSAVSGDVNNLDLPVAYKVTFREVGNPTNEIVVPSGMGPGELPPSQFTNPNPGSFSFPAGLVAEKTDLLAVDGDGDNKADPGDTLQYQVGIANHTGSDLTSVQFVDNLSDPNLSLVGGSITITPIAFDDSYTANIGSTLTVSAAASGILGNDVDPDGLGGAAGLDVTVAPVRDAGASTAPAGTLNVNLSDGTFTYTPNAGATDGQVEVFTYNIVDAQTLNALVTGVITFNITAVPAPDAMNDSYSSIGNVGIDVPAGAGVLFNDMLNGATITAFDNTSTGGGAVTLNTADGSFTYDPAPGFEGMDTFTYTLTNGGGMDTATVTVNVGDVIWFIDNSAGAGDGRLNTPFNSIAAYNGSALPEVDDHIYLAETGTNYTSGLTLLNNQRLIGEGATGTLAAALGITLPTHSNSLPALGAANNPVIGNAGGNNLTLASGNTVRGVDLTTSASHIGVTGNTVGSLAIDDVAVSGAGKAVDINTGALNVTFTSLSSNGAANGIVLNNTTGSFTVSGDGNTSLGGNGSGGTIQNGTIGVLLNNAQNVSLTNLNLNNGFSDYAIRGTNVNGFNYNNGTISGTSGDNPGADEGAIRFTNLTGSATVNGSNISGGIQDNIRINNSTGTLDRLTIDGSSFTGHTGNDQNDGVTIEATGNSTVNVTVIGSTFTAHKGDHFQLNLIDDATADLVFGTNTAGLGNTLIGGHPTQLGGGLTVSGGNSGNTSNLTFDIRNNDINGAQLQAINISILQNGVGPAGGPATDQANWSGTIDNNRIGTLGVFGSGSANGNAVEVIVNDSANMTVAITNNDIFEWNNNGGIRVLAVDAAASNLGGGTTNVTITGNEVKNMAAGGFPFAGINVQSGASSTFPDNHILNAHISGNTVEVPDNSFATAGIQIWERFSTVMELTQGGSTSTNSEQVLRDNNTVPNPNFNFASDVDDVDDNVDVVTTFPAMPLVAAPAPSGATGSASAGQDVSGSDDGSSTNVSPVANEHTGGASGTQAESSSVIVDDGMLSQGELDFIVDAAKVRWTASGLSAEQSVAIDSVDFTVADMPGWLLGSFDGQTVKIDSNAAGWNWYVDSTPMDDSEFDSGSGLSTLDSRQQMDLLTTVLHEMGHVVGLAHSTDSGDVMTASLTAGVRRVPKAGQANGAVPLSVNSTEYMVGPVNLGTLPAGKAVQINYQALISATATATMVSNQGTVTANGPISQVTDDPSTTTGNDPTVTPLDVSPVLFDMASAPNPIGSGGVSTLAFTIDNTAGTLAATAIDFTVNLPAAITVASPSNASTTCTGGTLTAASGTSVISYTGGTVAAGSSCTVQVDVTSTAVGTHVITTGDLTSSLGNSGMASDSLVVEPPPTFAQAFSPDAILVGGTSTLTYTIDNSASALAASGLDFTDNLPAGVVVATPASASTTCTGGTLTAAAGSSVISYTGGTVAAGASCTVQVDVTSSVAGAHVNTTGDLTSSSGNSGTAADTLTVIGLDFGDAPDAAGGLATGNPYPTLLEHNGARHALVGAFLGASIDDEADGQPDGTATGDDTDGNDDEDGVTFTSPLVPGTMATVDVTTTGAGLLNAWIDFNDDGDWDDSGEQIFTDRSLGAGANNGLMFSVPFVAATPQTFARFRFDQGGGLSYTGEAPDGEVEDYEVAISECSTTVTNTSDSGVGSLRYAILCANAMPGVDTIDFNIPGPPGTLQTIAPLTNLPAITEQATVDATTQMGYAGTPLIKIDGAPNLGLNGTGLRVNAAADGTIIRGLNIVGFFDKAIFISRADNTQIEANFIGTNAAGTAADTNGNNLGIQIINGAGNTIGGTMAAQRNLIGGNFIGVSITGANATNNTVSGNFIGTDVAGTAAIGNTTNGIEISSAPSNTVGGATADHANVISSNEYGIDIRGSGSNGNMVQGNFIGTNAAGTAALGNTENGVLIRNAANTNTVDGNVISGNTQDGVQISNANGNVVTGNAIGTDEVGTSITLGNGRDGVEIRGTSQNNTIGGTTMAAGNLISGNSHYGVKLTANSNQVQGNRIGTNLSGTSAIANSRGGVLLNDADGNTIGGANAGATPPGNQISGNMSAGIIIKGTSPNNQIMGNLIGTDAAGTGALPNLTGVKLRNAGANTTIGGDSTAGEGNVISGNTADGISMRDTDGVNVLGNLIGTNVAGTGAVGNGQNGVEIFSSTNIMIGDSGQGEGNTISGNTEAGVRLFSDGVTVRSNQIGTNQAGGGAIPNENGVVITSEGNTIGGDSMAGEGNLISGNSEAGVLIQGSAATDNGVRGNLIGTDAAGAGSVGNKYGVQIVDAPSNVLGGLTNGAGNTISGNTLHGVFLQNAGTSGNLIQANQIGTNQADTAALPNSGNGVLIEDAPNNTVGGTAMGAGNVVSGNTQDGVKLSGTGATGNMVFGNFIGTDSAGTTAIANRNGVRITNNASNNTIGDGTAAAANTIADNNQRGVWINSGTGNTLRGNSIHDNGGAARLGIDLGTSGLTPNDTPAGNEDADAGANNLQNFPVIASAVLNGGNIDITYSVPSIAPNSTFPLVVEFFIADSDNQEGETLLGSDNYAAPGPDTASVPNGGAVAGTQIVATATDDNGNTSEFSLAVAVSDPPPLLAAGGLTSGGAALSDDQLAPVAAAAIQRFAAAGLGDDQLALLSSLSFSIADLPGAQLGTATARTVTLDTTAAGYGWFVDPTPLDDTEFSNRQTATETRNSIDLLTVLLHELGHVSGHEHADELDNLMNELLPTGTRRLPDVDELDALFGNSALLDDALI